MLSADEFLIVDSLNEAVAAHPSVQFGSYPYYSNPAFKTVRKHGRETRDFSQKHR